MNGTKENLPFLQETPPRKVSFPSNPKYLALLFSIVLIIAAGVMLLIRLRDSTYVESPITQTGELRWIGLIAGEDGLLKIDPQKEDIDYLQQQPLLPPGISIDFWNSNRFIKSLNDGIVVFIGSPEISTAPDQNTIYSWNINSKENPAPFVRVPEGRKIKFFTLSPDEQKIAIVSVTRNEEEIHGDLDDFNDDDFLAEILRRTVIFDDERRTIFIYETSSNELIKTLKNGSSEPSSPEEGLQGDAISRLTWNKLGLFVATLSKAVILDPEKGQIVGTLSGDYRWPAVSISPNGQYYAGNDLVVRSTLNGEKVAEISLDALPRSNDDIIWLGPRVFSPDSRKLVAIVASDPSYRDFAIFEMDIETENTERIGGVENLEPIWGIPKTVKGLNISFQEHIEAIDLVFLLYDVFYDPRGEEVYFLVRGREEQIRSRQSVYPSRLNLVEFMLKEQKVNIFELASFDDISSYVVQFLGWTMIEAESYPTDE